MEPLINITQAKASPKLATVVEDSANRRIGLMSATYTGYQTCPESCPLKPKVDPETGEFKGGECYASNDLVGMQMHRLTRAGVDAELIQIRDAECDGIRKLTGKNILRLKVGGDFPNPEYAQAIAGACDDYRAKHNQPAYAYTHNWREIPREKFGRVSILASCDKPEDIAEAKAAGYATATIVPEFPNGAKAFELEGHKLIPCPKQINAAVQCVRCKLCVHDELLRERNLTIAFEPESRNAARLKARLEREQEKALPEAA